MRDWFARTMDVVWNRPIASAATEDRNRLSPWRRLFTFELLEPRLPLSGAPGLVPVGLQPTGTLAGKIVYTSPGHGWQLSGSTWTTDRPNVNSIVEGFGNQDELSYFADYLLRAGATVVPMRPIGRQVNEVVLDNDSAGVTYIGSWTNDAASPRWYDEDYGVGGNDAVRYRTASVDSSAETATATYTPNIPAAGFYPVYTWVAHGSDRTNQLYKINHTGGQTQVSIDHRMVGNGWVYLGTYHFNAGSSASQGSVQISNYSTAGGSLVIADSIRFGNGMGDLPWGPSGIGTGTTTSGQPREDEATVMWLWRAFGQRSNGETAMSVLSSPSVLINVSAPGQMAQQMNADTNPFGTSVYIGIHSNAFDGTARGGIGLITSTDATHQPTPNQTSLATFVGRQVNVDMRARDGQFETTWSTRTTYNLVGVYEEFNSTRFKNSSGVVEMDATVAEVAFHDNTPDSTFLRDPKGRDQIGRSLYEAVLEYFRAVNSPQPADITLPSAPTNVRAVSNAPGQVTVSWAAGPSDGGVAGVYGNAATDFRVYASTDGYGFDGGTLVSGGLATSVTLFGYDPTVPYYFKVAAVNAGGESKASEVLTVLPSGGLKQVLIVNGFDRWDRFADFKYTSLAGRDTGVTDRVWSRYNNSFDYTVQVMTAIQASKPGVHVASTSNEAVTSGAVNLSDYNTVIWVLGTESTVDHTFDALEQICVRKFINGGGNLFVSGADIAYDLDNQNNGRSFFQNMLGAGYVNNSAGSTHTAAAASGGIFAGLSNVVFSSGASFSNLDGQLYNVGSADVLSAQAGSAVALTYSGGTGGAAAIQKQGTGGKGSIVVFGFPFETITDATRRKDVMGKILGFFGVAAASADFNGDLSVDAGDYLIWRKNSGLTSGATQSQGDANGDGAVDSSDYEIWRQQLGTTPAVAASSSVAEGSDALTLSTTATPANESSAVSPADDAATRDSKLEARDAGFRALAISGTATHTFHRHSIGSIRQLQPTADHIRADLLNVVADRTHRRGTADDPGSADVPLATPNDSSDVACTAIDEALELAAFSAQ